MGFGPRAARQGYIYNPERNPNLAFLTDLPIDKETCLLPRIYAEVAGAIGEGASTRAAALPARRLRRWRW